MGRAKEIMMENDANEEVVDFLKELLRRDAFEGALKGIAKKVISQGIKSMSEKQKSVVDEFIANYKKNHSCERCSNGNISSLSDLIAIEDNSFGLCAMCEYDRVRQEEE